MPSSTISIIGSVGGVTIQGIVQRTEEGQQSHDPSLPKANVGTLSVRTTDTAGSLLLQVGHDIETGDSIDIFWTDANGVAKCAYGATVGTVSAQTVPFTGASGDVLPAVDYAITADELVEVNCDFDGDDVAIIALTSSRKGHFNFVDSTPTSLHQDKLAADEPWFWFSGMGYSNPLAGNPVDKLLVSNGDSDNAAAVKLGVLYNSVP